MLSSSSLNRARPPIQLSPSTSLLLRPQTLTLTLVPTRVILPGTLRLPHYRRLRCSASADKDLLRALIFPPNGGSGGETSSHFPAVRTYECDLAVLSLTGAVTSIQAITAAASDGGDAAEEHLSAGTDTMVVETVFPGGQPDGKSTVSTRLILPAKKVKEKAKKLRNVLSKSENILAMTFRQVVLDPIWSFKLTFFSPGTERNMQNLTLPREALVDFTVSSSDEKFLSSLAQVLCSCVIEDTKNNYTKNSKSKPNKICSMDSSICVCRIPEDEMLNGNLIAQVDRLKSDGKRKIMRQWSWVPLYHNRMEKLGGTELVDLVNEFVPAYRLQINADSFEHIKFEGWKNVIENRWEVLLTHSQMMELANILDMYYEDQYTLPEKKLSCDLVIEPVISAKKNNPFIKTLLTIFAGGFFVIFLGISAQVFCSGLLKVKKYPEEKLNAKLSENYCSYLKSTDASEIEEYCVSIVNNVKEKFGWAGDIIVESNVGAWIGALPSYLKRINIVLPSNTDTTDIAPDIASFQVVLSEDGNIIGFQPTNRVALNNWAIHPLAKDLYKGRKLLPWIFEPNLKIPRPNKVVLLELLMSANPDTFFVLARPIQDTLL